MDNRDLQSQLDKASSESEIKPFTIQNLISFAERDGINCENCLHNIVYKINAENKNECGINRTYHEKNHFCADFKPKDK
jgi:hypothetical protein